MANYDDEINDLLDRVETLEEGGGGGGSTPSASNVTYDDSVTSFGASTVQIALEKIKALIDGITSRFSEFLPKSGGDVNGNLSLPNGQANGYFLKDKDGTSRYAFTMTNQNAYKIATGNFDNTVEIGNVNKTSETIINGQVVNIPGVLEATASGNALPIVVENVEVTGSVNGSSTATIAGDVTKEGYTTLGILGYEIAGSSQCYCYRAYTVGNSARFYTRNNGSGTVNLTITAHILYQVDNGSPRIIEPPITNEGVE